MERKGIANKGGDNLTAPGLVTDTLALMHANDG